MLTPESSRARHRESAVAAVSSFRFGVFHVPFHALNTVLTTAEKFLGVVSWVLWLLTCQ